MMTGWRKSNFSKFKIGRPKHSLTPRSLAPHTRSSLPEVFCKEGVLTNLTKFTGKHLCQRIFFNKVAGLSPATLFKNIFWHRCFPVDFAKFLRIPFLPEHFRWLLLLYVWYHFIFFSPLPHHYPQIGRHMCIIPKASEADFSTICTHHHPQSGRHMWITPKATEVDFNLRRLICNRAMQKSFLKSHFSSNFIAS